MVEIRLHIFLFLCSSGSRRRRAVKLVFVAVEAVYLLSALKGWNLAGMTGSYVSGVVVVVQWTESTAWCDRVRPAAALVSASTEPARPRSSWGTANVRTRTTASRATTPPTRHRGTSRWACWQHSLLRWHSLLCACENCLCHSGVARTVSFYVGYRVIVLHDLHKMHLSLDLIVNCSVWLM